VINLQGQNVEVDSGSNAGEHPAFHRYFARSLLRQAFEPAPMIMT
jgi:hypothetical protein